MSLKSYSGFHNHQLVNLTEEGEREGLPYNCMTIVQLIKTPLRKKACGPKSSTEVRRRNQHTKTEKNQ